MSSLLESIDGNGVKPTVNWGQTIDRWREASAAYMRAAELNPTVAYAWYHLGIAEFALGRTDDAVRCFETATSIDPTYIGAYRNHQQISLRQRH